MRDLQIDIEWQLRSLNELNSGRMVMFGVGAIDAGSNVMFERKM